MFTCLSKYWARYFEYKIYREIPAFKLRVNYTIPLSLSDCRAYVRCRLTIISSSIKIFWRSPNSLAMTNSSLVYLLYIKVWGRGKGHAPLSAYSISCRMLPTIREGQPSSFYFIIHVPVKLGVESSEGNCDVSRIPPLGGGGSLFATRGWGASLGK